MKVEISSHKLAELGPFGIHPFLRSRGLDTSKPYKVLGRAACDDILINRALAEIEIGHTIYEGETLPDRIVGYTQTVVGLVPITKPWKNLKISRTLEERMSGEQVSSSKYFLDMRGYFDSIMDIDEYRRRNPGANGEVYTLGGILVDEDLRRSKELKETD